MDEKMDGFAESLTENNFSLAGAIHFANDHELKQCLGQLKIPSNDLKLIVCQI